MKERGHRTLDRIAEGTVFGKGKRRREELVTNALTGIHCYTRDEQYLVGEDGKVQIIDEATGRIMKDRSWQHGLHQAIEVKEGAKITADSENLARLSFQRFFRQYPKMCGMTGTAWEAAPELWQIYQRPVIRIPTNRPCIRVQLPVRMYETADEKWDAVVERVAELHHKGSSDPDRYPQRAGQRRSQQAPGFKGCRSSRAQCHADRTGSINRCRRGAPRYGDCRHEHGRSRHRH